MTGEPEAVLDAGGLEILGRAECERLLASADIGRLAFVDSGVPVVLPVNYRFHNGAVVFRTQSGAKLYTALRGATVAFEVDEWNREERTGWSVVLTGRATEVRDDRELEQLTRLGLEPWADSSPRDRWIRLSGSEISGRRIVSRGG